MLERHPFLISSSACLRMPLAILAALALAGSANAITIANALAPPNAENVLNPQSYVGGYLYVANGGCPGGGSPNGSSPACDGTGSTFVDIVDGAEVWQTEVTDFSSLTLDEGTIYTLRLFHNARFEMNGGQLGVAPGGSPTYGGASPITTYSPGAEILMTGGTIVSQVRLSNGAAMTLAGGLVEDSVAVTQGATFLFTGGQIGNPAAYFTSVAAYGMGSRARIEASARGTRVLAANEGLVEIAGGVLEDRASASGSGSMVRITGGAIKDGISAYGGGEVLMTGGAVASRLSTNDSGMIRLSGGSFSGGGSAPNVFAAEGLIEIHGDDFRLDGEQVSFGPISSRAGVLTGRLHEGELFEAQIVAGNPIELVQAAPTYDAYSEGVVELSVVNPTVLASGGAWVSGVSTQLRYLEADGESSVALIDAEVLGSVRGAGRSEISLVNTSVVGEVLVEKRSEVTQIGGEVSLGLNLRGRSRSTFEGVEMGLPIALHENASARLVDMNLSDYGRRIAGDGNSRLIVESSDLGTLILDDEATALLTDTDARNVYLSDASALTVDGGQVGSISASDGSTIRLANGRIDRLSVTFYGRTTVPGEWVDIHIWGGVLDSALSLQSWADGTISGGEVVEGVYTRSYATLRVSGGRVGGEVVARGLSSIEVSGGAIAGPLRALESFSTGVSRIEVQGSDFAVNGTPISLGEIQASSGRLTGTLASGEAIDIDFEHRGVNGANGRISVPEPAVGSGLIAAAWAAVMALAAGASRKQGEPRGA